MPGAGVSAMILAHSALTRIDEDGSAGSMDGNASSMDGNASDEDGIPYAIQWRVGTEVTVIKFFESDSKRRPLRLKPGMRGVVVRVEAPDLSVSVLDVKISFWYKKKWRITWVFPYVHLGAMMPTYAAPNGVGV